ncbi:metallophosphoesterase family protein [Paenibacillus pini]|uniref:Serine/threonine phosphatase n=1 Tax=Paenibacillus pini JCM 16418 TaxID=1236976 RepID=W7YPZ0_9BACL|nr:metallophosphoesterase family protein [Paenibacillus pini]GAF06616.1 serine/threonine phosphatase [Paenibacillus pini JCM 16418]
MKRTLVISDIHGCYDEFVDLLDDMKYQANVDQLIILGDLVDKGPKSKDVIELVITLFEEGNVIILRGNHDQRFIDVMSQEGHSEERKFYEHGGIQALNSYLELTSSSTEEEKLRLAREIINKEYKHHLTFLESLTYYYEDQNHIYVHAGLNPLYENWKEQPLRDFMYIKDPFIYEKTKVDKKVIFGHTKTKDIHGTPDIWFADDKIGIDGGCSNGMQLNGLEISDDLNYKQFKVDSRQSKG